MSKNNEQGVDVGDLIVSFKTAETCSFFGGQMPKGIKGFQKGYTPWNKGMKDAYNLPKGRKAWNKNKKCPQFSKKNNPRWNGGKTIDKRGYILVDNKKHPFCDARGYIREHRMIIEKQIGRYLLPKEVSHHIGKKDNNRPNMLMAFINQSAHKRFEKGGNIKLEEIIFDGRKLQNKKGKSNEKAQRKWERNY